MYHVRGFCRGSPSVKNVEGCGDSLLTPCSEDIPSATTTVYTLCGTDLIESKMRCEPDLPARAIVITGTAWVIVKHQPKSGVAKAVKWYVAVAPKK